MDLVYGAVGGIFGAAALTAVMMNVEMPLSPPEMVASKIFGTEQPAQPQVLGVHFLNGIVLGAIYAAVVSVAGLMGGPLYHLVYGAVYAVVFPWLVLGLVMLPMEGHGPFGRRLSGKLLPATFLLHVLFGAVTGVVYGILA